MAERQILVSKPLASLAGMGATLIAVFFLLGSADTSAAGVTQNQADPAKPRDAECQQAKNGAMTTEETEAPPCHNASADLGSGAAPGQEESTAETSSSDSHPETSLAISENAQGAFLLRQLLTGRQYTFFGRIEGEFALYDIPSFVDQGGAGIRRFKIGIAGLTPWFKGLSYKLGFDLTDGTDSISDAYLNFDFAEKGSVTLGNQDSSQSLSGSTGSLSQPFMESPLVINAFGLDKRIGISYDRYSDNYGIHALLFGRDLNSDAKHKGVAARAYFNPHRSNNGLWHLGLNYTLEEIGESTELDTRPESHVTSIKLLDTGTRDDVAKTVRYGFEAAGAAHAFSGRLEILLQEWYRENGRTNRFWGAYWESGYFITGQPFRYTQGKFVRPKLTPGKTAWELALRLSWLDLDDGDVKGGEEFNAGVALNCYPMHNLRGQMNVIHVNSSRPDSDGWLFQARLQFNW